MERYFKRFKPDVSIGQGSQVQQPQMQQSNEEVQQHDAAENPIEEIQSHIKDHARNQEVEKMLEDDVRKLMHGAQDDHSALLSLIDVIQKLGMSYRFEEEIFEALERLYASNKRNGEDGLHATALRFRILRQHGLTVSPDEEFGRFKDHYDKFLTSICNDIHGMMSLYEASNYGFDGEILLDEANAFVRKHLISVRDKIEDQEFADQIARALELPLHHQLPIHEAKHAFGTHNKKMLRCVNLLS